MTNDAHLDAGKARDEAPLQESRRETAGQPAKNGGAKKRLDAGEEVLEARERFLRAADTYEPLGVVRRHPFLSVGGAFAAGYGLSGLAKSGSLLPLLPVGAQIAALTAKLGLLAMENSDKNKKRS